MSYKELLFAMDLFSSKTVDRGPARACRDSTALVVIDMVNDYLTEQGAMPVTEPSRVIAANRRLVEYVRSIGGLIVWVRPGHTEISDGLFRMRIPHSIGEGFGSEIVGGLKPDPTEKVIRKRRYSAFFGTDLDMFLREHGIRSVLVSGVALNICVRSTVHDAFFNGYEVIVVEDACQATSLREHDSTVFDISTHFGYVVSLSYVENELFMS